MGNLLLGKRFRFFTPFGEGVTGGTNMSRWVGFLHAVKPYLHALLPIPMLVLPICLQMSDNGDPKRENHNCRLQFLCLWLSSKLWQHITYSVVGRQNANNMLRNNMWMATCKLARSTSRYSIQKLTNSPRSHILRAVLILQ